MINLLTLDLYNSSIEAIKDCIAESEKIHSPQEIKSQLQANLEEIKTAYSCKEAFISSIRRKVAVAGAGKIS